MRAMGVAADNAHDPADKKFFASFFQKEALPSFPPNRNPLSW
jgi:hypothetical protein